MVGTVLITAVTGGIDNGDPLFALSLTIVCVPPVLILIVGLLVGIGRLPGRSPQPSRAPVEENAGAGALGLLITLVQAVAGTTVFNSARALDLTIATVAGVGT